MSEECHFVLQSKDINLTDVYRIKILLNTSSKLRASGSLWFSQDTPIAYISIKAGVETTDHSSRANPSEITFRQHSQRRRPPVPETHLRSLAHSTPQNANRFMLQSRSPRPHLQAFVSVGLDQGCRRSRHLKRIQLSYCYNY